VDGIAQEHIKTLIPIEAYKYLSEGWSCFIYMRIKPGLTPREIYSYSRKCINRMLNTIFGSKKQTVRGNWTNVRRNGIMRHEK
jgi:hypothetical protein